MGSPSTPYKKIYGSLRFCILYNKFNKLTIKDMYPQLQHEDLLDLMGSVKYFISIVDKDFLKIVFFTRYSPYEWVTMPMGFTNASATLIQTMNNYFF